MKLLILIGLPGSGKSTWAKDFVSTNKDWVRVNRDDLRNMRGNYWMPKQEDMITKWENSCIDYALSSGLNVILDATNLSKDRNKERISILKASYPTLQVEYKHFETSLEECIKNDLKRPNSVGHKVIQGMYDKYFHVPVIYKEDKSLPRCVIFDIDGTLATMSIRSPFDWHRVNEDTVVEHIAELAHMLYDRGKKVIIFSGRDGVCFDDTSIWLDRHEIMHHGLFMRPAGNTEKDSIIKKRLFEENIRGKYYCDYVVDDRDQVVEMWRKELGLNCLQVNYGDF